MRCRGDGAWDCDDGRRPISAFGDRAAAAGRAERVQFEGRYPSVRGEVMTRAALKNQATLKNLTFVFALIQFVWLVWFYYTGLGGAQELVARVMAIALI